jgi:hypothetical protein
VDGGMAKSLRDNRQRTNLRIAVMMSVMKKISILGLVSNVMRSRLKALTDALPVMHGGMAKFPRNNRLCISLMRVGMKVKRKRLHIGLVLNAMRLRLEAITDALAAMHGGMAKFPRSRRRLSTNLMKVGIMGVKMNKSLLGLVANAVTLIPKILTNANGVVRRRRWNFPIMMAV